MSALLRLSRPSLEGLATDLETGRVSLPPDRSAVDRLVGEPDAAAVQAELSAMAADGMRPGHVARCLRLLAAERAATQAAADRISLVWTGDEAEASMSRDTAVVVRWLFTEAKRSLLIASFAVDQDEKAEGLLGPLAERMDAEPELRVRLFLNIKRPHRDDTPDSQLIRAFAERFRHRVWPGRRLPEVFHYPLALTVGGSDRACLHAKCVIADESRALVTSANLTEAAQSRNLEAGVLLEHPGFARDLVAQFERLVARGVLVRVPAA